MLYFVKNVKLGGYVEFTLEKKTMFGTKMKIERLYLSDIGFLNNGKLDEHYNLEDVSRIYDKLFGPYTDDEMTQEAFATEPLRNFKKQLAKAVDRLDNIKKYQIVNYKPCVYVDKYELVDISTINIATIQKMCNPEQVKIIIEYNKKQSYKK